MHHAPPSPDSEAVQHPLRLHPQSPWTTNQAFEHAGRSPFRGDAGDAPGVIYQDAPLWVGKGELEQERRSHGKWRRRR